MSATRTDKEIRFEWPGGTKPGAELPAGESSVHGQAAAAGRALAAGRATARQRAWWWTCYVTACCIVAVLGMVAALRYLDHDGALPLVWLNAFTRYLYLPAYACLAWAAWQRRWLLALGSLAIVACHVAWMIPDFVHDRRFESTSTVVPRTKEPSKTLRVFFANVAAKNTEHESLLTEIAAANPDVVVLVEFTWQWHIAFKAAPVMRPYKYGAGWLQSHIGSVNVFSKVPFKTETQSWVSGRAVHTVDIPLGDETLRLIGLHGPRPLGAPMNDYHGYWNALVPLLASERGPVVVVGDFNVTQHSRVYQELTAERLRSAHEDLGRGWATTWPNGRFWLPPIRIDQALLSPEVECVRIREGVGRGSDHKPLILDVRIRDAQAAPKSAAAAAAA